MNYFPPSFSFMNVIKMPEDEETLRDEAIKYLSIISEDWDEDISQNLMCDINYDEAFTMVLEAFDKWTKALLILDKLRKMKK